MPGIVTRVPMDSGKRRGWRMKTNSLLKERKKHRKPFDPEDCLDSHRTGLISVKTLQVGRRYPKTATKLTYLCTYCMWECNVFLEVLTKADS